MGYYGWEPYDDSDPIQDAIDEERFIIEKQLKKVMDCLCGVTSFDHLKEELESLCNFVDLRYPDLELQVMPKNKPDPYSNMLFNAFSNPLDRKIG